MSKRIWAWIMLLLFLFGLVGIILGFARGSNELTVAAFCLCAGAGFASFMMKKQLNEEIRAQQAQEEQDKENEHA
jgi:hypothetical protein